MTGRRRGEEESAAARVCVKRMQQKSLFNHWWLEVFAAINLILIL
jgi:hypothetical protein